LELGAARGYIGKRLEDAGVDYCGLEVSEHCYLTRASDNIVTQDLCMSPWQTSHSHFDLAFSIAVFEHIPERFLPGILDELKRTTMRGLHGIDFGGKDDGFDKTHCTLRPFSWWRQVFDAAGLQSHEIVDKEELEAGAILPQVLKGDGKVKLNLGCGLIMFRHGWCNIDHQDLGAFAKHDQSQFIRHDLRTGIPFNPGCVDLISIGHLLECLTYDEAFKLLRECRRVIKPDGLMRIQGVSAPMLLETWQHGEMHQYDQFSKAVADAKTQMRKLHELLNAGHQSTWDVETLNEALADSQFVESGTDYCFRGSAVTEHEKQMRRETIDTEPCRSFYVNAVPKIA
jgi:predicted SAM-dependent methyltransferase